MKRSYIRPARRGPGAWCALAEAAIVEARVMGYRMMRLDTLPVMQAAQALYKRLGVLEIPAYLKRSTPHALCFESALG